MNALSRRYAGTRHPWILLFGAAAAPAAADTVEDRLERLESGYRQLLEENAQLRRRLAEQRGDAPDDKTASVNDTAANQDESTKPESTPDRTSDVKPQDVQAGFGKIKFNGLLQAWYTHGDRNFNDTFRVRRAELKFVGEISPLAKWTIMVDPAKTLSLNNTTTVAGGSTVLSDSSVNQGSRILQDAFITLTYHERINVNAGQFKIPLGLEGQQSSAGLDTERALFASDRARGGNFGDIRDVGVMVYGPATGPIGYQLGYFNGSGESANDVDRNDQKSFAGRVLYRSSLIKGLQMGGSALWSGAGTTHPRRDRWGGELLYIRGPFTFKSEYMTGKDAQVRRAGYYLHTAYHFTPRWEGVLRFDRWDPDTQLETTAASVTEHDYIVGVNYFVDGSHLKLQFNYVRKRYTYDLIAAQDLSVLRLQTWW